MSDFNPREPIRLSDIDNLLEDSIFKSSNGAKLAEYLKKKRGGGGRVRLHNIFEQVAANMPKPTFNYNIDSSDPNPLPESPQQPDVAANAAAEPPAPSVPEPIATTSAPVQNGIVMPELVSSTPIKAVVSPIVALRDLKLASPKATSPKSPGPSACNLGRQALLNQYHRTNMVKCELLRQMTSSTPILEANGAMSRISAFTTSISPILETGTPQIVEPEQVAPHGVPPVEAARPQPVAPQPVAPQPVVPQEVPPIKAARPKPVAIPQGPAPVIPIDAVPPLLVLAPCSQAPQESTPRKVVVVSTPVEPAPPIPDMMIPETPSPVKVPLESPKTTHQILPRRLSATFNQLEQANEFNQDITSDESEPIEQEQPVAEEAPLSQPNEENSILRKSILKDALSQKKRHTLRVSFSQKLVEAREISPAPSIPEAHYTSSSDDSSDLSDEDYEEGDYQVIDETYSDDGAECDPSDIEENYNEYVRDDEELERRLADIHQRPPSPLINVVDDTPVQWYETRAPRLQEGNPTKLLAPATCTKDNKTNHQLVDIITDWDDEDDEEEGEKEEEENKEQQSPAKESQPPPIEIPETQPSTQNTNGTICNAMDISNLEDSVQRLVELPPPLTNLSGTTTGDVADSPVRPITPPTQFTDSAKHRFLRENEDALISRLQNDLPASQLLSSQPDIQECMSATLAEMVQSFRDQGPLTTETAASRKTIVPVKKSRQRTSPVDPATTSYFETVEKTFAKPAAPPPTIPSTSNQLSAAQKRKLYAATDCPAASVHLKGAESLAALKSLNIVIQKLRVDKCLEKLTDSDRATIEKGSHKVGKQQMQILQSNVIQAKDARGETEGETVFGGNTTKAQQARQIIEIAVDSGQSNGSESENKNNGRRVVNKTKNTKTKQSKVPPEKVNQPVTLERADEHSDERLNFNGEEDLQEVGIPEVPSTEFVDQRHEEVNERLIFRTPLDIEEVLSSKTRPKKRGRPTKTTNSVNQTTAAQTETGSSSKKDVYQTDEADEIEAEKRPESETSDTLSSTPSEISPNVEKAPQTLPFKKRKERVIDDELPALVPLDGVSPVESSDNVSPLLVPNEPEPSTSKQPTKTGARKHHEKHTTEKPEKKSKFIRDTSDETDASWIPYGYKKSQKNSYNQRLRKEMNNNRRGQMRPQDTRDEDPEQMEEVRRSGRTRRLAFEVFLKNPNLKSVYDKPAYRQLSSEEYDEAQQYTIKQMEKAQARKAKSKTDSADVADSRKEAVPDNRKRVQEEPEEPTASKRNRSEDSGIQGLQTAQTGTISNCQSATNIANTAPMERSIQQQMEAYSWMLRLMDTNGEQQSNLPVVGNLMCYSLDNLTFREHKGIQYSFYIHSEKENFGFLRFAPSAVKKLTKTSNFLLKFLILGGNLSFQLNGAKFQTKGGDFLMLPENSTYAIDNGKEVSLIFMIKTVVV